MARKLFQTKMSQYPLILIMAAVFSKSCQYAIQAVLYLARTSQEEEPVHVREMSNVLEIPHHFLGKILQTLSRHGIVTSQKGAKGGFHLARDPQVITLIDVIEAIEGQAFFTECFFGFPGCGDTLPCSIHEMWKGAQEQIFGKLRHTSVADLCREEEGKLNLTPTLDSLPQQRILTDIQ